MRHKCRPFLCPFSNMSGFRADPEPHGRGWFSGCSRCPHRSSRVTDRQTGFSFQLSPVTTAWMLVAAFWYNRLSSSLLGTIVTWVCAHKCFRGAGIDNLVLETLGVPLYLGPYIDCFSFLLHLGVIPRSLCSEANRGLELQLYLAEGEEKKVLTHGVSFSETKPVQRHTSTWKKCVSTFVCL